jgi:hypothetical protein
LGLLLLVGGHEHKGQQRVQSTLRIAGRGAHSGPGQQLDCRVSCVSCVVRVVSCVCLCVVW